MRIPTTNSLIDWIGVATEDMADAVARLNNDLDKRDTDPHWERKAWHNSLNILSLRRWAFLLPGGGALRGGRQPSIIPPATRGNRTEVPVVEVAANVPAAQVRPVR